MRRRRLGGLAGGLTLVALAVGSGPAAATSSVLTTSNVATPGDPFFALVDKDHPGAQKFDVAGSSDGKGSTADIRCQGPSSTDPAVNIVDDVALSDADGTFAQSDVPLPPITGPQACVIEALPHGQTTGDLPGAASPSFTGPRAFLATMQASKNQSPNDNVVNSVLFGTQKAGGVWEHNETGGCAIYDSWLTNTTTLESSPDLFYCNAWLYWSNAAYNQDTNSGPRSQLLVDGQNAYLPYDVDQINSKATGAPAATVDHHYDNTNGDLTVHSVEPIVRCVSGDPISSSSKDCPSVTSTGVQVETFVTDTGSGAGTSQVLQRFESTGGTHQLDMLFDNEDYTGTPGADNGGFRFPWFNSSYQGFGLGTVPAPPSGPGSFFFKHDLAATDGTPDGVQGAQTFAAAPESLTFIAPTNAGTGAADVELGYHRTVTDTTPAWFGWKFAIADNPTDTAGAAHAAEASFPPPTVAVTGPGNGFTTASGTVHVTGTSSDPSSGDLARVDVNGHPAAVAADGSWSVDVPLAAGSNNLTATALNRYDTPTRTSISVNYNPPAAPAVHVFHGAGFRGPHTLRLDRHGRVTVRVACPAGSAGPCAGTVVLTSAGKVVVAAAAKHKARVIRLGSHKFKVKPGKTAKVGIRISKTGRKLISKKRHLSARVTITSNDSAAQKKTKRTKIVLKPFRHH